MAQVAISGNTYPVKEQLKALGAKWDPDQKCWTITDKKLAEAQTIVAAAPPPDPNAKKDYRPSRCKRCGARPGPRGWPRIYRNGVCSDCYRNDQDDMPKEHHFTRADGSHGTWMEY